MQIGELATLTGVSTRALRHYEDTGVLVPDRTSSGYRTYSHADILRVEHIKAMISAGLSTAAIRRYLDCAHSGDHGSSLAMCPDLRAELDSIADRLRARASDIDGTLRQLSRIGGAGDGQPSTSS